MISNFINFGLSSLLVYSFLYGAFFIIEKLMEEYKVSVTYQLLSISYNISFVILLISFLPKGVLSFEVINPASNVFMSYTAENHAIQSSADLINGILIVYFCCLFVLLFKDGYSYYRLVKKCSRLTRLENVPDYIKAKGIFVYVTPEEEAYSFGVYTKRIVIPDLKNEKEIGLILYHEYSHIRDNDFLFYMIERVISFVLFFNPAVKLLQRKIKLYRECKADEYVISNDVNPLDYSKLIVSIASLKAKQQIPIHINNGKSITLTRLKLLSEKRTESVKNHYSLCAVAIIIIFQFCFVSYSIALNSGISSTVQSGKNEFAQSSLESKSRLTRFEEKEVAFKSSLLKDGLVNHELSTKIEFNRAGLFINGEKMNEDIRQKYFQMANDFLGKNFAPGGTIYLSKKDFQ